MISARPARRCVLDVGHQRGQHLAGRLGGLHRCRPRRASPISAGGGLAALGELAHFGGHHREAPAVLAGPGGFHRRVEGQQVGLAGDLLHDGDLLGDRLHGLARRG